MKVLQINTVFGKGSTGKIAKEIQDECINNGIECKTAYRYKENIDFENTFEISSWFDTHVHNRLARWTMLQGWFSKIKTMKFIKKVKQYNPDIIHLHNLHGNYININLLFQYIKKSNKKVIWTLHDCWPFTGFCPYFIYENCDKWKTECKECHLRKGKIDFSKQVYKKKKKIITSISKKNMIFVTPSKWLANIIKDSFLKDYTVEVINNGIDLNVFNSSYSSIKEKYNISNNKKIVLGVAFDWGHRKGLDVFIALSRKLSSEYQIVLVGVDDDIKKTLPDNIISICKTNNQKELAAIYASADVFVNPTREDNYPTVNMEAIACGTPVITFDTGGSSEMVGNNCGEIIKCEDIDNLILSIDRINKKNHKESCLIHAQKFDKSRRIKEYIALYENFTHSR